ncbi:MAG: histidine phosphatase family protein, partial [Sphaerochaetaceae bacterium]|nr:histidine phosphatase family protein [Sphaerochaetaceae bacterium]
MKVYIVRHGEIDLNKTKTVSGRKFDVPLNEKGRQQAKDLAKDILEHKEEYNIKHL